jgi:3-hydroxybutyryl-CoA dehydratase
MQKNVSGLDELEVGNEVSITVHFLPELVSAFGDLVQDRAPVHFDEAFARDRGMTGPIVHGLLVSSFFSGLLGTRLPGPNSVIQSLSLKFLKPVPVGATVDMSVRVKSISPAVGLVVLELQAVMKGSIMVSGVCQCIFPVHKGAEKIDEE